MPIIHIKSLPFEQNFDRKKVVGGISVDFSRANNINLKHVSVVWEFMASDSYAVGGETSSRQMDSSHPLLVDLLVPDFNADDIRQKMIETLASSIAHNAGIAVNNMFINCRVAHAGMVFDQGTVVRW